MGLVYRTGFWLYEPYFKLNDVPIAWYGTIFFTYNVIAALVARLGRRVPRQRHALLIASLLSLMGCSYLLPALFVHPASLALIALQQIVRGLYRPTLTAYLNERVRDENRATMISIVGVAPNIAFAAFSPIVGMTLDRLGVVASYIAVGAVSIAGWASLLGTRVRETETGEASADRRA